MYVASSLDSSSHIRDINTVLRSKGIEITYDWTTHGRVFDPAELAVIAAKEEQGVRDCDVFLMVLPGGGGTHYEFGVARTLNKPIVILQIDERIEQKSFYYLPGIVRCDNLVDAVRNICSFLLD